MSADEAGKLQQEPDALDAVIDDIEDALKDAVSDGEGRLSAYYFIHHLEKRGLNIRPIQRAHKPDEGESKDEARYRWLRNDAFDHTRMLYVKNEFDDTMTSIHLDEAIDAAIAAESKL